MFLWVSRYSAEQRSSPVVVPLKDTIRHTTAFAKLAIPLSALLSALRFLFSSTSASILHLHLSYTPASAITHFVPPLIPSTLKLSSSTRFFIELIPPFIR
jgi:hypothetical protein